MRILSSWLRCSTIERAIRRLRARADSEAADGSYEIVDPLFATWISRG